MPARPINLIVSACAETGRIGNCLLNLGFPNGPVPGIVSETQSTVEPKHQVLSKESGEVEGKNIAAGEPLDNSQGFYIYTERWGGERVSVCPGH